MAGYQIQSLFTILSALAHFIDPLSGIWVNALVLGKPTAATRCALPVLPVYTYCDAMGNTYQCCQGSRGKLPLLLFFE